MQFFRNEYGRELSLEGRFEFWNLWYIMIIINDILLIGGSALKEEIERKVQHCALKIMGITY